MGGDGGGRLAGDITGVPVVAQAELQAQQLGAGWHHGGRVEDPAQTKALVGREVLGAKKKLDAIPPK